MLNGAAQTVVTTGTALSTQAQTAEGKIHVIHQNQQLLRCEAKPVKCCPDGTTAVVHEGLRHQQPQALITDAGFSSKAMQLGLLPKSEAVGRGHPLQSHEADVVAGAGILAAGISQANHQLQPISHE